MSLDFDTFDISSLTRLLASNELHETPVRTASPSREFGLRIPYPSLKSKTGNLKEKREVTAMLTPRLEFLKAVLREMP